MTNPKKSPTTTDEPIENNEIQEPQPNVPSDVKKAEEKSVAKNPKEEVAATAVAATAVAAPQPPDFLSLEKTISYSRTGEADPLRTAEELEDATSGYSGMYALLTVFAEQHQPYILNLKDFQKNSLIIGNAANKKADIELVSRVIAPRQAKISLRKKELVLTDTRPENPTLVNGIHANQVTLKDGDVIRINDHGVANQESVLILFSSTEEDAVWKKFAKEDTPNEEITSVSIGRSADNDIIFNHIGISAHHAKIVREPDGWYLYDLNSTNGLLLNGCVVRKRAVLHEKDVISISNSRIIFSSAGIYYNTNLKGLRLEAQNIVKVVKDKFRSKTITNNISLEINPGELVAIIGTSGSGKTTFLNCISGYDKATRGKVLLNNEDLYKNFSVMKSLLGYVPQQDIVYDNLTLQDMLLFSAKLRMPKDTTKAERLRQVKDVIEQVELQGKENLLIRKMSGGQKKRASIAVELLSDPKIFFLDEPTSGLDPATEAQLMRTLRRMTSTGRTVVLVTHSTLCLDQCDKLILIGTGGNLCYTGSPADMMSFFETDNYADVYQKATEDALTWADRFSVLVSENKLPQNMRHTENLIIKERKQASMLRQTRILCSRYFKLIFNDRIRTLLLVAMAPFFAYLISLVKSMDLFTMESYSQTKSVLFVTSCCIFWMGVFNSIQEVCKEKHIIKREHINGLKISSYVFSKIIVLGVLGMVQSALFTLVFDHLIGLPHDGVVIDGRIEFWISTFLLILSATAMGLFASAFFSNPDRAMTFAPILVVPQILFAGVLFVFSGNIKYLSYVVSCRWAMEAFAVSVNMESFAPEWAFSYEMISFTHTATHLYMLWGALAAFVVVFTAISVITLKIRYKK